MWLASEMRARLPVRRPPTISATMKPAVGTRAIQSARSFLPEAVGP
jgi:hypothetical protein